MRTVKFVLTICLFAVFILPTASAQVVTRILKEQVKTKSHKEEEKPLSNGSKEIVMSATVTRSGFDFGGLSGPAWNITMLVQNPTDSELELGESLVLLEKARSSSRYLGLYIAREREAPAAHLARMSSRYGLTWGYEVKTNGQYSMAFVGGGHFSMSFSSTDPYEGLAYGRVSPRAERKIEVQIPAPYSLKEGQGREYFVLILPSVRLVNAGVEQMTRTMLRFDVGEAKRGDTFKPVDAVTMTMRAADLRAVAVNSAQEDWRRIFTLNWLVEAHPKEAVDLLLETVAQKDAPPSLRSAAAINLGAMKVGAAIQPLSEVVRTAEDVAFRQHAIEALGEIGNPAAAPVIRPLLDDASDELAVAAIKAVGKLKDAEAVGVLLVMLKKNERRRGLTGMMILAPPQKSDRDEAAADALAAIGNRAAVEGLLGLLRDPRPWMPGLAAEKLGLTGSPDAVAPLADVVADRKAAKELQIKCISSLGKLGGPEALAALRGALDSEREELREAAISALGAIGGQEANQAMLAALKSRHSNVRAKAASQLRIWKQAEAITPLWQAYQIETDEGTSEAIATALIELKFGEKEVALFLMGRLDPKVDTKKKPYWFDDVRLLRHLTGQKFGPEYKRADKKQREAELLKWRQWWESANAARAGAGR